MGEGEGGMTANWIEKEYEQAAQWHWNEMHRLKEKIDDGHHQMSRESLLKGIELARHHMEMSFEMSEAARSERDRADCVRGKLKIIAGGS